MAAKSEIIEKLIMSGINGNHLIHDATHLAVNVKTKGFMFWKKTEIHISGRVDTDREKKEIDKILETESKGLAIINNLRVHKR